MSLKPTSEDHHKIPESFSAFWRIVSFTAAKTRRIFEVSVACVRLDNRQQSIMCGVECINLLWIEIQVCSVHLVKAPEKIFRRTVHVVTT